MLRYNIGEKSDNVLGKRETCPRHDLHLDPDPGLVLGLDLVLEVPSGATKRVPTAFVLEAEVLLIVSAPNHVDVTNPKIVAVGVVVRIVLMTAILIEAGILEIDVLTVDMTTTGTPTMTTAPNLMMMDLLKSQGGGGEAVIKSYLHSVC